MNIHFALLSARTDSLLNTRIKLSREAGHPSCAYRKDGTMIKEEGQEFERNFDVGKDMLRMEKASAENPAGTADRTY